MPDLRILAPYIDAEPSDFSTLELSCGKFIDAWLADGGEPTDDEVVGFYSLWSQSLDARGSEEANFYRWAYPLFVRYRDELVVALKPA